MTYQTGDSPNPEEYDVPDIRKGWEPVMGHTVITTRSSGRDGWTIVCECGRRWHHWRYICEEYYIDHLPQPDDDYQGDPRRPLWWDEESYKRYQGDHMTGANLDVDESY